ncbi:MAG TPA: ATP-binding protein [Acidimicrobiales bacterium]|jgi:hypothetical protein|nr:ATP-binding protein [Acidimicrobiales bacterium]
MTEGGPDPSDHTVLGTEDLLARSMTDIFGQLHMLVRNEARDELVERLQAHLGADPRGLPVVNHELPPYQLVDVQVALEAWVTLGPLREFELIGVSGDQRRFHPLSELLSQGRNFGVGIGPVEYVSCADSATSTRSCVRFGIFLMRDGDRRVAALLRGDDPHGPMQSAMLELIGPDPAYVEETLAELRQLAVERSVLRGQVLALGPGEGHQYGALRFMPRPSLSRDQLVLPDLTLGQIERHVVRIAVHGERLQAAGQHLKRGVLLYGPPGTGKTHTVRYLLSELPEVTAFILSGQSLGLIGMACGMARLLQPSIVILEDVDLIAGDRSFGPMGSNPLLFEVLNQIDGLGDDVDVTFLLTTNRVDILERALAERPGRVDAAVEIAPPDADGRSRLFRLYGTGLGLAELTDENLSAAIAATEGRTATYIREVVRRAAIIAAEEHETGPLRVDSRMLADAAHELLDDRAALTRSLLGEPLEPDAEPPFPAGPGSRPPGAGPTIMSGMPSGIRWARRGARRGPGQGPPVPFGPEE